MSSDTLISKNQPADFVLAERERIRREYLRREREIDPEFYGWQRPAEQFTIATRNRAARVMLRNTGLLPLTGKCLEVGCGAGGWLSEMRELGLPESRLHGIDLDPGRADRARSAFPQADIRVGDGVELPWPDDSFRLVIASTLFTSVLDSRVRQLIANEIQRVLSPSGALLWYDFAYNNPRNANVRGVKRSEIRRLFPMLTGRIRSVTLFPPLARVLAPKSESLVRLLEGIPVLRTHLLAVLCMNDRASESAQRL